MAKNSDLRGMRFGKLTAIEQSGANADYRKMWQCLCDCGREKRIQERYLLEGRSQSCGCARSQATKMSRTTHGKTKSREYGIWRGAKERCSNPTHRSYENYGGAGIRMSQEWEISFSQFFSDMGECPLGYTLERKNNKLGYSKENCIWASRKEQSKNSSVPKLLTVNGATKNMTEWAAELGMSPIGVRDRILRLGWTPEKAVSTPKYRR